MYSEEQDRVSLGRADLQAVTEAMMARFPTRVAEAARADDMRRLLAASADLVRTLNAYTQHGLVHCQGSRGCMDLEADTAALYAALGAWCEQVQGAALKYRYPHLGAAATPLGVLGQPVDGAYDRAS